MKAKGLSLLLLFVTCAMLLACAQTDAGLTTKVKSKLAADDVLGDSDLLSYILFDGRLGAALIELGRADADAQRALLPRLEFNHAGEVVQRMLVGERNWS